MRILSALALGALLAATGAPAIAEDAALTKAETEFDAAWSAAPLSFRKVLFVTEATAFGVYTEKAGKVFRPGEPVVLYTEPVGFGYRAEGDGSFSFGFDFDLTVTTPDGKTVAEQQDFARVTYNSHAQNKEFLVTLTLDLTNAPAGDYVLEYVARDIASSKTATISVPLTIAE